MPEVDLPLNLPVPAISASSNVRVRRPASILVIDDEAGIRESLEVLLTLEGYSVSMASDGEQGLRSPRARKLRSRAARPRAARPERP